MRHKINQRCAKCHSTDIVADAFARWDFEEQKWEVSNVFHKGSYCNNCEGECRIEEFGEKAA